MSDTSLDLSQDAAILGLDNVALELPLAGVGSRSLAAVVDYLLLFFLMCLWWTAGLVTASLIDLGGFTFAIIACGSFVLQWGYFALLEIAFEGRTPGKNIVGLRVVTRHGGRASAGALVVRNLLRAVDMLCGLPVIAVDRHSRRLGDMVAGTLVVHATPPRADDELRLGRVPDGWGAREIAVVESFLRRAPGMEPARARALAEKLLRFLARRHADFLAAAAADVAAAGGTGEDPVVRLARLLRLERA